MDILHWTHYYNVIKQVSSLAGQWPYQKPKSRMLHVSLVTLSIFSINIPQIAKFVTCDVNFQCIFETMTSFMLATMCLVKLYTCYLNHYKMNVLTDHLFVDWKLLEASEEYKIMIKNAKNARQFSLGYSLYCFIALCLFLSMSLIPQLLDIILPLNKSRPILPIYPGYYFVDEREYFFYIFLHAIIAWGIAMTGIIAHDCMFLTYVEHICGIFDIVGFRFKNLFCNHSNKIMNVKINIDTDDIYCNRIAFIVHTHQRALRYAQLLENTFNMSFGLQILVVTIGMSITLLQMTQQNDNSNILESLRYALFAIGQLIHLFFLNFEGQKLIDHSLQIRDKIYYSYWYKVSVKSQKLIILVMIKSLRLSTLSAGKVFIFSLASFTTILQTSMSYYTVLASI